MSPSGKHRIILGTWNLETFTIHGKDTRKNQQKITNIVATINALTSGCKDPVIIALQEISAPEAVTVLIEELSKNTGIPWNCSISPRKLGNHTHKELAAFIWTRSPHIEVDVGRNFQLFSDADFSEYVKCDGAQTKALTRSPFFGLFRVFGASLILVNCHLSPEHAVHEVGLLPAIAAAIEAPNHRILHRQDLLCGLIRQRQPKGAIIILGDFNLSPTHRRGPGRPRTRFAPTLDPVKTHSPPGLPTLTPAWEALRQNGWKHAADISVPTNWHAKQPMHYDDILIQEQNEALLRDSGVCEVPIMATKDNYPNHLLVWTAMEVPSQWPGWSIRGYTARPLKAPVMQLRAMDDSARPLRHYSEMQSSTPECY